MTDKYMKIFKINKRNLEKTMRELLQQTMEASFTTDKPRELQMDLNIKITHKITDLKKTKKTFSIGN